MIQVLLVATNALQYVTGPAEHSSVHQLVVDDNEISSVEHIADKTSTTVTLSKYIKNKLNDSRCNVI